MIFDRFDIVAAHYAFWCLNHEGQWSPGYRILCRISKYFNPGHGHVSFNSYMEDGSNCREIYLALCAKHGANP